MRMRLLNVMCVWSIVGFTVSDRVVHGDDFGPPLPNTEKLALKGDIASYLVDGVDRFLLRELELSVKRREAFWNRDTTSEAKFDASIKTNRDRLSHMLGIRDARANAAPQIIAEVGQTSAIDIPGGIATPIRWRVFREYHAEGWLLEPTINSKKVAPTANVVAIPDADQTPEQIIGLAAGVAAESQFARHLLQAGCRVVVPTLISRQMTKRNGRANLSNREFVYRSAFELGRHLIGYEVQTVQAVIDWFHNSGESKDPVVGVMGYGEGGAIALYTAAVDTRVDAVCVSGYFDSRQNIWSQPLDRNVFGLLQQFGDAELASMVTPRGLVVEISQGPEVTLPGQGGAPAELKSPKRESALREFARFRGLVPKFSGKPNRIHVVDELEAKADKCNRGVVRTFLRTVVANVKIDSKEIDAVNLPDATARQDRLVAALDRHNQWLLRESPFVRKEFMKQLDLSSVEKYSQTVERYRDIFREDVIGRFDQPLLPGKPRTRQIAETDKWTRYEVVLDVFPDVIAYGILTLPKGMQDEQRPVVVCQHGLEGRPQSVIGEEQFQYYKAFATKLAERGFITFAPQNLYIFKDRFRTLQRKANPIKKTLFSIIVPQHQQIVNWLKTLPNVDGKRIAFYGLSYGGKSAMRIPPLVTDYCLSICSADFNEWVLKNASTRHPFSYVWTGEYEIFEFDLGSTFNYAEMAALICPRPFMVERGHFDGVGWDEWVAFEFAKVRHIYNARLHIPDRCEIEWFVGPHSINSTGTFEFLHRHLNFPRPKVEKPAKP
ncbi:MAG: dienelactone hydrolase family protein [Planctomycetota bacterium]|nr:dienelactone hydrolase family protein [Planctomycetota bacterium]